MASHKSAKKRIRTSERRRVINKKNDSKIKTLVKKTLASKDKNEVEKLYKEAISFIDKSTTKGNLHRNNAARKKSTLSKYLNKVSASK
ncbi:MAG: 30S ribosomal protein S20 [Ignavibacteriaceae bacterium]|nr:30S ribosomal protein S20 [Ignavibacteriaceae bacterium]